MQRTPELRRVLDLPRRDWQALAPGLVEPLTKLLTLPGHVCRPGCAELNGRSVTELLPWQAAYCAEVHDHGGAFAQAGVGEGKTLVSMVLGPLVAAERTLIIVPASMVDDTWRKFAVLRQHWRYSPLVVQSYHFLSNAKNDRYLWDFFRGCRRGLLTLDEAHFAKNVDGAACARRIDRFIQEWRSEEERTGQQTLMVADMTGTSMKRSCYDFAHLLWWARPAMCPLPVEPSDLHQWAGCLDEDVEDEARLEPGALEVFAEAGEDSLLQRVRRGVSKRIFDTPGLVSVPTTEIRNSLVAELVEIKHSEAEDRAFSCIRSVDPETPDGDLITDAVALWRISRQLDLDFFYKWDPAPPEPWRDARRAWHKCVRDILARSSKLDTELQVANAVRLAVEGRRCPKCKRRTTALQCAGAEHEEDAPTHEPIETIAAPHAHDYENEWLEWQAIKGTFEPNTVPVWVGDTALRYAAEWAEKHTGIVWTEHRAFAEELSKRTGLAAYMNDGRDSRGRFIEDHAPKESMIASIASNGFGRNLQAWSEGLVTSCPPTGTTVQQLLGRMHRPGQKADTVTYTFMVGCREKYDGFFRAKRDCLLHKDLLQSKPKLMLADVIEPRWKRHGFAWKETSTGKERKREVREALEALRPASGT